MEKPEDVHASCASPCYAVLIYLAVICRDGAVHLEKQIQLPFVPWVRLMLEDCDSTDWEYVIEGVYWSCRDSRFMCRCKEIDSSASSKDEVMIKFLSCGWIESA
jgi:hypothetical protein